MPTSEACPSQADELLWDMCYFLLLDLRTLHKKISLAFYRLFFKKIIMFILAFVVSENRLQHVCILLDLSLFLFGSGMLSRFGGCLVFVGDFQIQGSPVGTVPVQSTEDELSCSVNWVSGQGSYFITEL